MNLVISGEQTMFIKNCQILDGSLMVNKVVDWYKKKKKKTMLRKIDFKKSYNSVSWSNLDSMLHFMNSGENVVRG